MINNMKKKNIEENNTDINTLLNMHNLNEEGGEEKEEEEIVDKKHEKKQEKKVKFSSE